MSAASTATKKTSPPIVPRHPKFDLHDAPADWIEGEPAISHFFDGLSLTFPEGERFFVDSVKAFRDEITDPELKEQVRGFAGQEAVHAGEHRLWNLHLRRHGLKPQFIENGVRQGLKVARWFPKRSQLAMTCALEHFTALLAEAILTDDKVLKDANPECARLWRWHALEESEHRAVAFDVYKAVAPGARNYIRRVTVMTVIVLEFTLFAHLNMAYLMARGGHFFNGRTWGRGLWYLWGKPGLWRKMMAGVADYYRPSFHPSDRPSPVPEGDAEREALWADAAPAS